VKKNDGGYSSLRNAPRFSKLNLSRSQRERFRKAESLTSEYPKLYNSGTVADFLGWRQPDGRVSMRIRNALSALEATEDGLDWLRRS